MKKNAILLFSAVISLAVLKDTFHFKNNSCSEYWAYPIWFLNWKCHYNPDIGIAPLDLLTKYGYKFETHKITTSDDYFLTLFRIFPKKPSDKAPVFIQHGLATNSDLWISPGNKSMVFNLADDGYEIWLGNYRGVSYSQGHKVLKVSDTKYWNFSVDTLGLVDVREQLKYVGEVTGKGGYIIYISHSLSTCLFYLYSATYPEEAKNLVQGAISIAPVAYIRHAPLIIKVKNIGQKILNILRKMGKLGIFYEREKYQRTFLWLCRIIPWICKSAYYYVAGETKYDCPEDMLLIVHLTVEGITINIYDHMLQSADSGLIQKFDYGPEENLKTYNNVVPPIFNFSKIQTPLHLFYGKADPFISQKDLKRLIRELGTSVKTVYSVPSKTKGGLFNHMDFFLGNGSPKLFYKDYLFPILNEKFQKIPQFSASWKIEKDAVCSKLADND